LTPTKPFRFSIRSLLVSVTVIAVLLAGVTYAIRTVNGVRQVVMDAYRVWGTGELMVDYMNANDQRWPQCWADLETFFANSTKTYTIIETFDDIRDHIDIDFAFDPYLQSLANDADDPPFRAIWLRNGTESRYVGAGPNQIVYAHLKELAKAQSGPAGPPVPQTGEPSDAPQPRNEAF